MPKFYNYMKPHEYLGICREITGLSKMEVAESSLENLFLEAITPQLLSAIAPGFNINMTEPITINSRVQIYKNVSSLGFSSIMSNQYAKGTLA